MNKLLRILIFFTLFLFASDNSAQQKSNSDAPITVFTIGDSTMADYTPFPSKAPMFGWSQVLQNYFDINKVVIARHASSGKSCKTFISLGLWNNVLLKLKQGDYVLIQFGHNDEKDSSLEEYRANLAKFIKESRMRGAIPILLTPTTRRTFNGSGVLYDSHITDGKNYPETMRTLAKDSAVQLIDITKSSMALVQSLGVEGSKIIYLWLAPGVQPNYPDGTSDNTHFSEYGANEMAKLAIKGLKEINSPLVTALKEISGVSRLTYDNKRFCLSNQILRIVNPQEGNLSLYSISGKLLKSLIVSDSNSAIDLSGFQDGLYIVHLSLANEIVTSKILKLT